MNNYERLQAMLDAANRKAVEEDCIRRMENRLIVSKLRHEDCNEREQEVK